MLRKNLFSTFLRPPQKNKIIKSLNSNKATGPDRIPLKIIKTAANVTDFHLAHIINKDLKGNRFSEDAKTAFLIPFSKKGDRGKIKNYRPVTLFNGFSKIYKRFLHDSLSNFTDKILSKFVSAYRKSYSSNHVLLKLIEEWKKSVDYKNTSVLMDLSFYCIFHDLLLAKLRAYGLSVDAITFIYSYMKRIKQGVKINETESLFKILLLGVPQGSILGPILFNIVINDLLFFVNEAKQANFADDNMIYAAKRDLNELLRLLEKESEVAIKWFSDNNMIVNPKTLQAIIINRQNRSNNKCCLTIKKAEKKSKESAMLVGIEIDKLNFENNVSTICKKANNQLTAISRIGAVLGQKGKETLINSFVYSNFNYGPLI